MKPRTTRASAAAPGARQDRAWKPVPPAADAPGKRPYDVDEMVRRIRAAVRPHTPAAMFRLDDEGHTSVFETLVACVISIRALEEVTLPTARDLFAAARTPGQIDRLIGACTFHEPKSRTIHATAARTVARHDGGGGGGVPCDYDVPTNFAGVGPKCANLVLGIACDDPHGVAVHVHVHVHRVTNRWGYVAATTPEKTMADLEQALWRKYWVEINKLLVPFGKFVCTGKVPKCSTCPVLEFCPQVGVTSHR